MSRKDPYAEFNTAKPVQGKAATKDPYAEFSGQVAVEEPEEGKRSLGATGSWEEPDAAQKLQINHPYLSMPLTAPAKIGRGAIDALYGGTVGLAKTVASPPSTPEEIRLEASSPGIGGAALIAAKRLLIDPGRAEYQKAKESPTTLGRVAHKAAAFTPVVGPMASHLYERGVTEGDPLGAFGEAATMYLMGKVGSEATGAIAKNRASPNVHAEINALSTLAKPAKNQAPQSIASESQHFIKRAIEEAGEDPATFQLSKNDISNPKADQYGDLYRGGTAEQAEKFAKAYDIELDPNNPTPISSMVMERAVEIADRPIQKVTQAFAQQRVPVVKAKIIAGLQKLAQGNVDKPLKDAYNSMIQMAMDGGDTVADINALKVHANKEINRVYKMLPQQAINASASPSFAWKDVGDLVRQHLYPELERLQGPEGGAQLRAAGRKEANVINMRDGVMENWTEAAKEHAESMQQSKFKYVMKGQSEQAHIAPRLKSAQTVSAVSRAWYGRPMPLKEFNQRFTQGIGVGSSFLPAEYKAAWKPPSISPTLAGDQGALAPFGEGPSQPTHPFMPEKGLTEISTTQGTPAEPLGSNRYGSKGDYSNPLVEYADTIRQRMMNEFGKQMPKRPPLENMQISTVEAYIRRLQDRGVKLREVKEKQLAFGERATPQWTGNPKQPGEFFPGKQGPMREPLLDEHGMPTSEGGRILKEIRDYRRQSQLFGIDQTKPAVPKFAPSIDGVLISTQDLKTTLNEIQVYLKNNPTSGQRSQLMLDSIDLLREINRRYAASQVNKK